MISRARLMDALWDVHSPINTRAVDARIAELRRADEHLLLTLLPYDAELEYAVLAAAYLSLLDPLTRPRPLRTRPALVRALTEARP